jgi:dynein heavy chain 1
VRRDLGEVIECCSGAIKQTNILRDLIHDINSGAVPKSWKKYKIPDGLPVNQWVIDLCNRLKQLAEFAAADASGGNMRALRVCMGGLFVPEAFITATRQTVAQAHGSLFLSSGPISKFTSHLFGSVPYSLRMVAREVAA